MATLLLTSVAQRLTGGLTGVGGTLIQAAAIGAAGIAGKVIDQALLGGGSSTRRAEGPRLESLDVMVAREGAPMADLDGRYALGGVVFWATRLQEVAEVTRQTSGGKGIGGPKQTVEATEFRYLASFAVGLGEGPLHFTGRAWADGKPADLSGLEFRFYPGTDTQDPDPLIVAKEGAAPAFRGTAYVVFEGLDLAPFGNRVPQWAFEVVKVSGEVERLVRGVDIIPGSTEFGYLPSVVRQVSKGSRGEIVEERPENAHRHKAVSDWSLSLDALQGTLPNCGTAALVVAWFGSDLRAGLCEIAPKVEIATKLTDPVAWSAAGLTRATAGVMSQVQGRPAFGSTPADLSVVEAIKDLRARGFRVVLYPFVLMDIPAGAGLPEPSGEGTQGAYPWRGRIAPRAGEDVAAEVASFAGQASAADFTVTGEAVGYTGPAEWRFRRFILHLAALAKAAGGVDAFLVGSELRDLTFATGAPGAYPFVGVLADLAAEVKALLPSALVSYAADWSEYHSHRPAPAEALKGGVFNDPAAGAFWTQSPINAAVIDYTAAGLNLTPASAAFGDRAQAFQRVTTVAGASYALRVSVAEVPAGAFTLSFLAFDSASGLVLAATLAAPAPGDHVLTFTAPSASTDIFFRLSGTTGTARVASISLMPAAGDVFFHLDPLWSAPAVDFVGIDNYLPLADWREGVDHADYRPDLGWTSAYSLDYLKANIEGGEFFDWFYASDADRAAQVRTPITDGAFGEPWVFRQKAIRDWHGQAHHNRPGGVRDPAPTAWVPGSKPVWFTEIGCPAIDLGANQPNVFASATSSESALPHFSAGTRDDFMARQFVRAALEWWRDNGAGVVAPGDVLVWSWDARPFPEFPIMTGVWADGPDWIRGHWWNGRAGAAPAAEAIRRRLVERHGFTDADLDLSACYGQADGYPVPGAVSFRDYLQPWEAVFRIDAVEEGGKLIFRSRAAALPTAPVAPADMVDDGPDAPRFSAVRAAVEDVARVAILRFPDGLRDYDEAAARDAVEEGGETGIAEARTPLVLDLDRGTAAATMMLRTARQGRERRSFALPPSRDDVRPGRLVEVEVSPGRSRVFIVDRVTVGDRLLVEASSYDPAAFAPSGGLARVAPRAVTLGASLVSPVFLDLPLLLDQGADDWKGWIAAHGDPWPGGADFWRSTDEETGFALNTRLGVRAAIGETVAPLDPGRLWTWSGERLEVRLYSGTLVSRPEADVLEGLNALAIEHAPGAWEVLQFREAELIGPQTWAVSALLRGQRGTEDARGGAPLAAGARVVVLDPSVRPVDMTPGDVGRAFWWRFGPAGADQAGDLFGAERVTFQGIGRRPFAPIGLAATPAAGGDLGLAWIRRTRIEGDAWPEDAGDVPLGEASESYLVEIGPEGAPWRAVTVPAPAWTYTAAQQAADGAVAPYAVRIAQLSETFGRGPSAAVTVTA